MSFYQQIAVIGPKLFKKRTLMKYGFNLSPMYRCSTAYVTDVSDDLLTIKIKLPISYKNRNYVNSIFGGSMFSAVDPIPMVQLINILDNDPTTSTTDDFVVWDKSAIINFKKPAKEDLYATFTFSNDEIDNIKNRIQNENEIEIIKTNTLTNIDETVTFCEIHKTIYIANKEYYKTKLQQKRRKQQAPQRQQQQQPQQSKL